MKPEDFNTKALLTLMADLQFIAQAAKQKGMTAGRGEPRYDAVEIKAKDLIGRLEKLIPVVMLAEIEAMGKFTKDMYELFGESESEAAHGRGN